jgi:hypothetical protein
MTTPADTDLLSRLSQSAPQEEQRSIIEWLVAHPEGINPSVLILPSGRKDAWENAAEVLSRIGSPRIDSHVPALLEWLMDPNWPGAGAVLDLCKGLDRATLQPHLEAALKAARAGRDTEWEDALRSLAEARGGLAGDPRSQP